MIRNFQKTDTKQVMKIWLNGNEDAHPFIPKDYWKSNYSIVEKQLLQAEIFVYEMDGEMHGFTKKTSELLRFISERVFWYCQKNLMKPQEKRNIP